MIKRKTKTDEIIIILRKLRHPERLSAIKKQEIENIVLYFLKTIKKSN